jgi:aminoglycoside phosphotransferase (APT) family kinase protein
MKTDSTTAIRTGEELDITLLNEYLKTNAPEVGEVLNVTQFPGGYSNLTYCLHTADQEYVLRRPPFGAKIKSAHDMGREFRVLSLLKPHYAQVPKPIVYCEDEAVMGCSFYVMERLKGIILRAANAPKMNLSAEVLRKTSEALIDNLVTLHGLNIEQTELIQLSPKVMCNGR